MLDPDALNQNVDILFLQALETLHGNAGTMIRSEGI